MPKIFSIIPFLNSHNFTPLFFYFASLFVQLFLPKTKIHLHKYIKQTESLKLDNYTTCIALVDEVQGLPNESYVEMIASHSYSFL